MWIRKRYGADPEPGFAATLLVNADPDPGADPGSKKKPDRKLVLNENLI